MDLEGNKMVIHEFDELGNGGGDIDRLEALCMPDIVNQPLAPGRPQGIEGTGEFFRSARRDVHPVRWLETHVVAEGDLVVQFGTREQHWPGGSFRGFEIPSGVFTRDTAFAYRLVDGRICERWAIRDDLGMMLQLGAVIAPVP
jgi:ketosteroid isomerase-like protein